MNKIQDLDPVQQVRQARKEIAEKFHFDLQAIIADAREREQKHPERLAKIQPAAKTPANPSNPRE
jgi:hypothetical protein